MNLPTIQNNTNITKIAMKKSDGRNYNNRNYEQQKSNIQNILCA